MEIGTVHLNDLRNGEHFQFQTDVKKLIESKGAETLNIKTAFTGYVPLYEDEKTALDKIRKSAISEDVAISDARRDSTFRGTSDAVNSSLRHFNPAVQSAAKRVKVIFDHFGNLTIKPYDEETAEINKLIAELNETCQADMETIRIADWVVQLQTDNDNFISLKNSRYTEEASKTQLQMKIVRNSVDNAYTAIIGRIAALMVIDGESAYVNFVNELNQRVESYNKLLAQRKGRNHKDDHPETDVDE